MITTDGEAEEGIVTGDALTVQGAADLRVLGTSTGISAGAVTAAGSATLTAEASLPDGKAIASVGGVLVQDTAVLSARSNGAGGRAVVAADVTVQGDADLSATGSLAGISATNAVTVKNTANLTALADGTAAEAIAAATVTVQDEADLAAETGSSGGTAIAASGDVSVQGAASLTASAGEGGQSVRAANTKLIPAASRRICAIAGENAEAAQPLAGSPFAAETTLTDPLGRYFEAWGADSTTLTLASNSGSIIYGESVDYTVQAAGTAAGTSVPTGKVQFYLGSTDQGNELGEPLMLQDGRATLTLDRSTLIYTGTPYKVLAVYEGDRDYAPAQSETTTAVAQRQLEWKAELSASKAYDGTTAAPDVYGTVEVSGVLDGDDVVFGYTDLRAAEFTASDGGTTETLAVTVENAALTGAQAGNYLLPAGALTVEAEIHETETVPAEPESPSTPGALLYRVQIEEGISRVPDSLTGTYRSPAELEKALYDALAGSGIAAGNMAAYDFVLYVSSDDGSSWTPAAADQFPDQGLTLTLPYPAGTGSSGIDFVLMQALAASADVNPH